MKMNHRKKKGGNFESKASHRSEEGGLPSVNLIRTAVNSVGVDGTNLNVTDANKKLILPLSLERLEHVRRKKNPRKEA